MKLTTADLIFWSAAGLLFIAAGWHGLRTEDTPITVISIAMISLVACRLWVAA